MKPANPSLSLVVRPKPIINIRQIVVILIRIEILLIGEQIVIGESAGGHTVIIIIIIVITAEAKEGKESITEHAQAGGKR